MKPASDSVLIIGGGVVGLATALSLQERGLVVTIADPGSAAKPSSWGNAGRIAVELSEPLSSLATLRSLPRSLFVRGGPVALPIGEIAVWLPFGVRLIGASLPKSFAQGTRALSGLLARALPAWRARLAAIGGSVLLIESGHYSIWETSRALKRGREAWRRNAGAAVITALDDIERERIERLLAVPVAGVMKFSGTANIADPTELLDTMATAFLRKGGRFDRRKLTVDEAATIAERVVVAAGVGSADLLRAVGHRVPLVAERGYHIEQAGAAWPAALPPMFFEERSLVLTRFRSGLRATSFVEFAREGRKPDPRKWDRLRRYVRELGLPFDDRATTWCGARPTFPDYLPAIGRSTKRENLFYAFGHQHLGLTLAAITGDMTAALMCDDDIASDLAPFDLARFA